MIYTATEYKCKYDNDVTYIRTAKDAPIELYQIADEWRALANAEGDHGSCVLGAGFLFKYHDQWFFMPPLTHWQGSLSWERNRETIQRALEDIGVTDLRYEWGNMV